MAAPDSRRGAPGSGGPFALDDPAAYRRWRQARLAREPSGLQELVVPVQDIRCLAAPERAALLAVIARAGFALYRTLARSDDAALPRRLGAQLGMLRLDANWLAGEDGISRIQVAPARAGDYIPYTDRALGWHTDGYYHPGPRRIRGMVLHCVRPARAGGDNRLLDPELAYIALRDRDPRLVRALMQPDAMTIPARSDEAGVARPAQPGPVFCVDADGGLHMRYTARTRSIAWKNDAATRAAAQALRELMEAPLAWRVRLEAGMGLAGRNVLHDRSAFIEDPARPRLLLRARFLDPPGEPAWRNG